MHAMQYFFVVFLIILTGVFMGSTLSVFAQEESQNTGSAKASTPLTLPNISVREAIILEVSTTTLKVGFSIVNGDTIPQADIRYGIEILKAANGGQTRVDTYVPEESLALSPKESMQKEVTYTIPLHLKGEYEIWVLARTTSGMVLGLGKVGTTTFTGEDTYTEIVPESCSIRVSGEKNEYTLHQGVDVSAEEVLSFSCTLINHNTSLRTVVPSFETFRRSMYGEKVETVSTSAEEVTLKANEKKTVIFTIPRATVPQAYNVSISLKDKTTKELVSNMISAHYVLRGQSATIHNIQLDKRSYLEGETLNLDFTWTPSADGFSDSRSGQGTPLVGATFILNVSNENGVACISPVVGPLSNKTNSAISAQVVAPCITPSVIFTIKDSKGVPLDSYKLVTPVRAKSEITATGTTEKLETPRLYLNYLNMIFFSGVLILIMGIVFRLKKRKNISQASSLILKSFIFFTVLSVGIVIGSSEVKAATVYQENDCVLAYDEFSNPYMDCSNANIYTLTILKDGQVYTPGESVSFTYSAVKYLCGNGLVGSVDWAITTSLGGPSLSSATIANNWNPPTNIWSPAAPLNPGSYYLAVSYYFSNKFGVHSSTLWAPFTVIPAVCSAPLNDTVDLGCPVDGYGNAATGGSRTQARSKSAYPSCSWVDGAITNTCTYPPAICATPTTEAQSLACPPDGYGVGATSGSINQSRNKAAYPGCAWGSWTTTSNTCTYPAAVCSPSVQTQTTSCPTDSYGEASLSGQIDQSRSTAPYPGCAWGSWTTTSNSCVYPANLTSSLLNVNSSVVQGTLLSFNATVKNEGGGSTGIGFSDNFSYQWNGTGAIWTDLPYIAESVFGVGASSVDYGSYTPNQTGTLYIQHCVDSAYIITEGTKESNCTVSSGITVNAPNTPPIVNAGINQYIVMPTSVAGPSSASASDPGGSVASIVWTRVSGPVTATITGDTTLIPTFSGMSSGGTYVFRLTVTDNQGSTASDDMEVWVDSTQCGNGLDDDSDGNIDLADFGCTNIADDSELTTPTTPDLVIAPRIVDQGDTVTMTWDTHNENETECSLTGGTLNGVATLGNGTDTMVTGHKDDLVVNGMTKYTLTCGALGDTFTVEIRPQGFET